MVGSASEDHLLADELAAKLAIVGRAVSTRSAVQILAGMLLRAEGGSSSSPRPTWSSRCAPRSRRRWTAKARSSSRAGCWSTCRACCPTGEVDARAPRRGERRCRSRCGAAEYRLQHLQRRGLPAAARRRGAPTLTRRRATRCSTTVAPVSRAVSRDESRPVLTGILVRFERRQARDGRDRLVPALGQGDADRGRRCRSSRRSSRRARSTELARIAHGGGTIELGVHENQVSSASTARG